MCGICFLTWPVLKAEVLVIKMQYLLSLTICFRCNLKFISSDAWNGLIAVGLKYIEMRGRKGERSNTDGNPWESDNKYPSIYN